MSCLLYTSDAADERSSVDLGGRRIIKKKNRAEPRGGDEQHYTDDSAGLSIELRLVGREERNQ